MKASATIKTIAIIAGKHIGLVILVSTFLCGSLRAFGASKQFVKIGYGASGVAFSNGDPVETKTGTLSIRLNDANLLISREMPPMSGTTPVGGSVRTRLELIKLY